MLPGLKARAEGRPDAPLALISIAQLGWAAAGIAVAGLFLSKHRHWFWLVLLVLAALPALIMSHDVQAGLVAFLGVGIPVLGFLNFGRGWWGSLLIIASIVLLTLLLAPEAYTVMGLAFILLLLAGLVGMIAVHSSTLGSTKR